MVKTYLLAKKTEDIRLSIVVENLTDQTLSAVIRQEGVVGIKKEDLRSEDRKIFAETIQPGQEGFQIHPITRDSLLKLPDHLHRIGAINEQVVWAGQVNKYFAALLAVVDEKTPLSQEAQTICQPLHRDGQRYRGLNPWSDKDAPLLEAVSRGEFMVNGFRNRDLRALLYSAKTSQQEQKRRTAAVTRKLRLLRAHRLIRKG